MRILTIEFVLDEAVGRALRNGVVSVWVAMASCGITCAESFPIFTSGSNMTASSWRIVNDGVMGGKSKSSVNEQSDGALVFKGRVSLENNGGFASTRSPIITEGLGGCEGLELTFTGDGKRYKCGIRTNNKFDGVTYQASFITTDGNKQTVRIPFEDFVPTWRGRQLSDVKKLNPGEINNISFMISDKQEGAFVLAIESIAAYRSAPSEEAAAEADLITVAREAGMFNTLLAALDAAGLTDTVSALEGVTLFAPTDQAFDQLPEGTVSSLLEPGNKEQLVRILTYHVIESEVPFSAATTLKRATALNGEDLAIEVKKGALFLNEARVIENDIDTANGVLHVIDAVLLPPDPSERSPVITLIDSAIRRGVPLFNSGNPQACSDLYELAAEALLLLPEAELQESQRQKLSEALQRSKGQHCATKRAWTMRGALDETLEAFER